MPVLYRKLQTDAEYEALVDVLGEEPETVLAVHLLRHHACHAYVAGPIVAFQGAIVQGIELLPDEPIGFGNDAEVLANLLSLLVHDWYCINVVPSLVGELGQHIENMLHRTVRYVDEVHLVLRRHVQLMPHPAVRLLTIDDLPLLDAAPKAVQGAGFGSTQALLTEGIVAGAILDGHLVAIAHTSARTSKFADIGINTLPPYQGQGMATAAAGLVAQQLQRVQQQPVWSTGITNLASRSVAAKLGFEKMAQRSYVVLV